MLPITEHSRALLCAALCGVGFFLGTADRVFAVRFEGVNLRLAYVLLGGGVVAWAVARRTRAAEDVAPLVAAWLPFCFTYALAAVLSPEPLLTLLKLGWFAFAFLGAYVWCLVFDRVAVVRGLFGGFALVACIIVCDFATGFSSGVGAMIGFGQANVLVEGVTLWRPHAFYYEPSYAATGVGLAWALAMTRVGRAAPRLAVLLVIIGAIALVVVLSRTGWLYALIVLLVLAYARVYEASPAKPSWFAVLVMGVGAMLVVTAAVIPSQNRHLFVTLAQTLGVTGTLERVCPSMIGAGIPRLGAQCEKAASAPHPPSVDGTQQSSEGLRIADSRQAVARVAARPLLGHGVTRGVNRLIEPTTSNVWLEMAVEGGALSVITFGWGLALTLKRFGAFRAGNRLVAFVLVLHFAVAWQFIQTFARLDQWLVFWAALTYLARSDDVRQQASARPQAE